MAADTGALVRIGEPLRYAMGTLYVVAGVLHFAVPDLYVQVVPPSLPRPLALVYLSGAAEVLLGVGVMYDGTRRYAAWGLIALLIAVFPANVYMATNDVTVEGLPRWMGSPSDAALWARLPLQAVLALWAWWYTRPTPSDGG